MTGYLRSLVVVLLLAAPASAQVLTISSPGNYTLSTNVVAQAGVAIRITASDVTLNLNAKSVRCVPLDPQTATDTTGIQVQGDRVVIWGGSISGCHAGVVNSGRFNTFLVDLTISATAIGAQFGGGGNTIRRVVFKDIGGYTLDAYAIGVNGIGRDGTIEFSTFENIYRQPGATGVGEGAAIIVEAGATSVAVENNTIRNARLEANSIGVWSAVDTTGRIANNVITNFSRPVVIAGGMAEAGNTVSNSAPTAPSVDVLPWRVCFGTPELCYSGTLNKVPGPQ